MRCSWPNWSPAKLERRGPVGLGARAQCPRARPAAILACMNDRGWGARRPLQIVSALLLALCSGAAMALGLGDIRVLSAPGQPLLAEIPVISTTPGELDNVRVALAPAVTFERIGLPRPEGLIGELRFQVLRNADGAATIRVTSTAPVHGALSFLIEVDWEAGRLVREYSALVDVPIAAPVLAEPAIEAPRSDVDDAIVRAPAIAKASPSPTVAAKPMAAAAPVGIGSPVQRGQTLSQIALPLARASGHTLDQTMLALQQANPTAFIDGNINRLRQGVVLRAPAATALASIDAAAAAAQVRAQVAQWRQARAAIPQPADSGVATSSSLPSLRSADARLEIAALAKDGAMPANTRAGGAATAEGDAVTNQQLQQAREDVASRDAEIQELRSRVQDLEQLRARQAKLIALKDTDLAAAQQRLAAQRADHEAAAPVWFWGVLVLALAAFAGWLASRRRKPSPFGEALRRESDGFEDKLEPSLSSSSSSSSSLAQPQPQPQSADTAAGGDLHPALEQAASLTTAAVTVAIADAPHAQAAVDRVPPDRDAADSISIASAAALPAAWEPSWHLPESPPMAPLNPAPAGRDRLELAVAYLDLGDRPTARSLLHEVVASGDAQVSAEASALLARLDGVGR